MELTIQVTPSLLTKLRVLNTLQGERQSKDFSKDIAHYVELCVEALIQDELATIAVGSSSGISAPVNNVQPVKARPPIPQQEYDYSVDDGLSNEDLDEDEDEAPPKKQTPKAKETVSMSSFMKDNTVEDPEHEALSEDGVEMTFEELMGINSVPVQQEEEVDTEPLPVIKLPPLESIPTKPKRSVPPRKLPKDCKGTVSGFIAGSKPQETF